MTLSVERYFFRVLSVLVMPPEERAARRQASEEFRRRYAQ